MFGSVIEAQNLGLVIWDKKDIVYINARIIAHLKDAQIDIRDRQQVRKLLEIQIAIYSSTMYWEQLKKRQM